MEEDVLKSQIESMATFVDSKGNTIYLDDEIYWECMKEISDSEIIDYKVSQELLMYAETQRPELVGPEAKEYALRMVPYFIDRQWGYILKGGRN